MTFVITNFSIFVAMDNSCRSALFRSSSLATLNFQFFIKGIAIKMYIFWASLHFTTRCLWHQKILSSFSSFCWYAFLGIYAPLGMTVPLLSCHATKHDQESQCKTNCTHQWSACPHLNKEFTCPPLSVYPSKAQKHILTELQIKVKK